MLICKYMLKENLIHFSWGISLALLPDFGHTKPRANTGLRGYVSGMPHPHLLNRKLHFNQVPRGFPGVEA